MPRRPRGPAPGEWQYTVGDPPHQVTAYERADRGFAIYARVWDGQRYTEKRRLHDGIRDEDGRIDPELELAAQELAIDRHRNVAAGVDEDDLLPQGPLTLEQGFRRLLHPKTGKYAGETRWKSDVERAVTVIQEVLDGSLRWDQVRHAHYRKLWRHMAREHKATGAFGARMAEVIVGTLQSAARWLQQEGLIEPGDALPAPTWKEILQDEWSRITGEPIQAPKKPRFTPKEKEKIWEALPLADPRIELAVELAAELRIGQLAERTRRSDVLPFGGFALGMVLVHGRGKKLGAPIILTRSQRHALTRALLRGYLAEAERAYAAGEIDDYFLIPKGHLHTVEDHRGRPVRRARVERVGEPMTPSGLRGLWKKLQEVAGVEEVKGRNWYGLRRRQTDDAEDTESDARVLNRLGGWKHTGTREGYQEEGRVEVDLAARDAREQIRPKRRRPKGIDPKSEEGTK